MANGLTPPQILSLRPQRWMAAATLLLGIGLSVMGWHNAAETLQQHAASRFAARTQSLHHALQLQLDVHAQALRGAQAYIGSIGEPDQERFSRLYRTLRIAEAYPGIAVFSYLSTFPQSGRGEFERRQRRVDPNFRIRPDGGRDQHAVVTVVEPRNAVNLRAVGSDSLASDLRREAIEAARDSGETRITGKLNLVIDDPEKAPPAFLMYQAVYRDGRLPETLAARRNEIVGYIIGAFRVDALMKGVFGGVPQDIALRVFDGDRADQTSLYFASHPDYDLRQAAFSFATEALVGGRKWRVEYASLPAFEKDAAAFDSAGRLLLAGLLVSLLLASIVWSLASTRARAIHLARRMTESLRASETKLRALFEQAPVGIWLVDSQGKVIDCNGKFCEYAGAPRERIVGFPMLAETHDPALDEPIRRAIAGESVKLEAPYTSATGARSSIFSYNFQPVAIDGRLEFVLCFVEDVSARKLAEAKIEHLAHHDTLTGLANRALLKDRLQQAILVAQRGAGRLALFFIDLDFFKHINDTVGHSAGDAVLIQVAQRLRLCVRESDTLARVGGDEFVILLTNLRDTADCARVAEAAIAAAAEPVTVDRQTFNITASIGIALWPDDGPDSETLTRNADVAMYHAKKSGRNNYQFFAAEMNARAVESAALERDLREALAERQFVLHYQIQVDARSGRAIGTEALLRWQHPQKGLLLPGRFVEVAEERGVIDRIGNWVLHAACRQAKAWHDAGHGNLQMAVNISPLQLHKGRLVDSVISALADSGLPPANLALEITEGAVMEDIAAAIASLQRLRDLGVQIEIDDFGTGHSSLAYLKQLPIQRLKIDRSFVRDLPDDAEDAVIVGAIINLAASLHLDVIAEGVETEAQRDFLLARGCHAMQGYHFGRPLPAGEALQRRLR